MESRNKRTFVEAKKTRGINDLARERSGMYKQNKKLILGSIKHGAKSIPQISAEINLPLNIVTYYLMTCRKYGEVEVDHADDNDEYFLYKIKEKITDGSED